jgi:hypothetical protein
VILIFLVPALALVGFFVLLIAIIIIWAHRENIKRIMDGKEPPAEILAWLDKIPIINKIPDDLIGWTASKLEILIKKIRDLQNKKTEKKPE